MVSLRNSRGAAVIAAILVASAVAPAHAAAGKPGKPRIVSISSAKSSSKYVNVTVKVKAGNSGGSKVTSTRVSSGSTWCMFLGAAGSCRLTHIPVGSMMRVTAVARNAYGRGLATKAVKYKAGARAWRPAPNPSVSPTTPPVPTASPFAAQFGTGSLDEATSIDVDADGNIYVAGSAPSTGLLGTTALGSGDTFVAKYGIDGHLAWAVVVGTPDNESNGYVKVSADGYVYVATSTSGHLPNLTKVGGNDFLIFKLRASDGTTVWADQTGTALGDGVSGIALGNDSVYVVGNTIARYPFSPTPHAAGYNGDGFVARYAQSTGAFQSSNMLGTCANGGMYNSVAVAGSGDVVVGGQTSCGDLVIAKYAADLSTRTWLATQPAAVRQDLASVAVDSTGDVYYAGDVNGAAGDSTAAGYYDAQIGKVSGTDGSSIWRHSIGTSTYDYGSSVLVNADGSVSLVGSVSGTLDGAVASGAVDGYDGFVSRYSAAGALLGSDQFGTADDDNVDAAVWTPSGQLAVVGRTYGAFPGASAAGSGDAFVLVDATRYAVARPFIAQGGTVGGDHAYGVAHDADGNVYVAGKVASGALTGATDVYIGGSYDGFVAKYAPTGARLWIRHIGTSNGDYVAGVGVGPDGSLYVAGGTGGAFPDKSAPTSNATFVAKLNPADGTTVWVNEVTDDAGNAYPDYAIAVTANHVYVVGTAAGSMPVGSAPSGFATHATGSATAGFVASFAAGGGGLESTRMLGNCGTAPMSFNGVTVDNAGYVIVSGSGSCHPSTGTSTLGNYVGFVNKYSSDLQTLVWSYEVTGATDAFMHGLAVDSSNNVYFAAEVTGNLAISGDDFGGSDEALVGKLGGGDGAQWWLHTIGSDGNDMGNCVKVARDGTVVFGGWLPGALTGYPAVGAGDGFVATYTSTGTRTSLHRYGTLEDDVPWAMDVTSGGSVITAGRTAGAFPGQTNSGATDFYVGVVPWRFNP